LSQVERIKVKKNESTLQNYSDYLKSCFCCCGKSAKNQDNLKKEQPKLKLESMNKNISSIMLSYLPADEVGRLQQASKKMYVLSNNWALWKNIIEDQYKKKSTDDELSAPETLTKLNPY
jgi:hypothetical protein